MSGFSMNSPVGGGVRIDDSDGSATGIGSLTQPASGSVSAVEYQFGPFVRTDFTLNAAQIAVTDAGGSGSHGTIVLYTLPQCAVAFVGSRQNYTAFAEGAALTGAAGDAVFEIGVGTTAISAAADGTLGNGVNENVGQAVAVTLSGGTGTGTAVDGCKTTALNGTASATTLNLNFSGSAATIDATSTIDVTGTISVLWCHMGDD